MKVVFLISARGTGIGGHFYSLKETVAGLSNRIDCAVANIGRVSSPALSDSSFPYEDFLYNTLTRRLFNSLCDYYERQKPDVIHAFDVSSLYFARWLGRRFNVPVLFTKCGGPNPQGYFPKMPVMILYSKENETYFLTHPRYHDTRLHLLPNRVNNVPQDRNKIERLRLLLDPEKKILLRITRIGRTYERSILQSIALVKRMISDGIGAQFLLIGVVNDTDSVVRIQNAIKGFGCVITDKEYVTEGSQIIDIGDAVVATGRGFMEAAVRGRILLASINQSDYPVLVTPENWQALSTANFSTRGYLSNFDPDDNYRMIKEIFLCRQKKDDLINFIDRMARESFMISNIVELYLDIYKNLKVRNNRLDMLIHRLFMLKRDGSVLQFISRLSSSGLVSR